MEKKKVAIVTLGDSRREFYKKREAIELAPDSVTVLLEMHQNSRKTQKFYRLTLTVQRSTRISRLTQASLEMLRLFYAG